MRRAGIAALVAVCTCNSGFAATWEYAREAQTGVPKVVWRYVNYDNKCQEAGGVAKVIAKPLHGTLSKKRIVAPHLSDRINPASRCIGKMIPGLEVTYKSFRGYRGMDKFVIERTLANGRVDVDTFVMTVR